MKIPFVSFLSAISLLSQIAHAQIEKIEPTPAELAAITQRFNEDYAGTFIVDVDNGSVRLQKLGKDKVLVEAKGELAKFMLYNLSNQNQILTYIPRNAPASWTNEFVRRTEAVTCGLASHDLKADPMPIFKCRFTVDRAGKVEAFEDRPGSRTGDPERTDFFYEELKGKPSQAWSYNWVKVQSPDANFELSIGDQAALRIYSFLATEPKDDSAGPYTKKLKIGEGLWCSSSSNESSGKKTAASKCTISFRRDGTAKNDL